ncbi:hypothetical protein HDU93_001877 [Gonapodya sp. JEL0774]|nr:hypothetical protein HDU93_001877 [Gonapodya sp. JEL0774]
MAAIAAPLWATSSAFAPSILSESTIAHYSDLYGRDGPYPHAVIANLFDEDLLLAARKEVLENLQFSEKETDIYKVNQTGDLANLDGLPDDEKEKLVSVHRIRDALYSHDFRKWVERVTKCGPLSTKKRDMSLNVYTSGCHLLNHDDVISTRRVSFILYLSDPDHPWQPEWGGKLELYPTKTKATPDDIPARALNPLWNHLAMFTVVPGVSSHSVEEVVAPQRARMSVQGWYHRPQEGEEGYDEEVEKDEVEKEKEMSSLANLSAKQTLRPFVPFPDSDSSQPPLPGSPLTSQEKLFLSHFINPAYLVRSTQVQVSASFGEDSHVLLQDILRKDLAGHLEKVLRKQDRRDGFVWWEKGEGLDGVRIVPHATGTARAADGDEEHAKWTISGPPHQQRYCVLLSQDHSPTTTSDTETPVPSPLPTSPSGLVHLLSTHLFPSAAFRHLLSNLTGLVPISSRPAEARRFRPGLDYTLARADVDAVLDVTVCLTPDVVKPILEEGGKKVGIAKGLAAKRRKVENVSSAVADSGIKGLTKKQAKELGAKWEAGEVGGWECYMAPHDGEEDPAVYRSAGTGKSKEKKEKIEQPRSEGQIDDLSAKEGDDVDEEMYEDVSDEASEDDDSGALLNLTPTFNTMSIVLRDAGVMRFVKYVSASAGGSRWDVVGEYEVGEVELEE